jgi:hypothetical protein
LYLPHIEEQPVFEKKLKCIDYSKSLLENQLSNAKNHTEAVNQSNLFSLMDYHPAR